MKLLALDQSSKITGWAVFENQQLVEYGKIDCGNADLPARLTQVRREVKDLIQKFNIDEVVMEDIQLQNTVGNNVVTYKALAETIGVLSQMLHENGIPQSLLPSSTWKSQLGIKGRARVEQKRNAQLFINNTYNIKVIQDIADAICIGTVYSKKQETAW